MRGSGCSLTFTARGVVEHHPSAVLLGYQRRIFKPHRARRRRMYVMECLNCGVVSQGPASPAPRGEMQIAAAIADICIMWEPSRWRSQKIDRVASACASIYAARAR